MSKTIEAKHETGRVFIDQGIAMLRELMGEQIRQLHKLAEMPTDEIMIAHLFNELGYAVLNVSRDDRTAFSLTKGGQAMLDYLEDRYEDLDPGEI